MRPVAIVIEVLILIGVLYCFIRAARLTILDLGFQPKYDRFLRWALGIVGGVLSAFFVAHLTLFYPRFLP